MYLIYLVMKIFFSPENKIIAALRKYGGKANCYDENGELLDVEDDEAGHDHISRFCIILGIDDIKVMSLFSKVAFDAIENQKVD